MMVAVYLFFHGAIRFSLISPSSVRDFEVSWCVVVLKIDLIDYGFASSSFTAVFEEVFALACVITKLEADRVYPQYEEGFGMICHASLCWCAKNLRSTFQQKVGTFQAISPLKASISASQMHALFGLDRVFAGSYLFYVCFLAFLLLLRLLGFRFVDALNLFCFSSVQEFSDVLFLF